MNTQVNTESAATTEAPARVTEAVKPTTVFNHIHTYDQQGKVTDTRVIDMSDNGARKWFLNHCWWATTNSCMIGVTAATKDDHDRFQLERLAKRFNKAS
jgi:hypothetical protein